MGKHSSHDHDLLVDPQPADRFVDFESTEENGFAARHAVEEVDAKARKNHPPVANDDTNGKDKVVEQGGSVKGDAKAIGNVLVNDTDKDGDHLKVINAGTLEGKFGTLKLGSDGTWSYLLDNKDKDTQALKTGQIGVDKFNYTVSDGHGGLDTATLKINIAGTDDPVLKITLDKITKDDIVNQAEAGGTVNVTGKVTGAENGDTVTLLVNGHTIEGTVKNGRFSVAVPGADFGADGTHKIQATVESGPAHHTLTATTTESFTVDTTPPAATVTLDAITGDGVLTRAELDAGVTISGSVTGDVKDGDTVMITIGDQHYNATVTGGAFSAIVSARDLVQNFNLSDQGGKLVDVSLTLMDAAGNTAVITGQQGYGLDIEYDLGNLATGQGFKIGDSNPGMTLPGVAASVGDVNGDGYDDVVTVVQTGTGKFSAYGLFGSATPGNLDMATSAASHFTIAGLTAASQVSSAGDVNGDGIDDLIVSVPDDSSNSTIGKTYIVFGSTSLTSVDLSTLTASQGVKIPGADHGQSGYSISAVGDINGDGIDDIVIGAPPFSNSMNKTGSAYVIYGRTDIGSSNFTLGTLPPAYGFTITGTGDMKAGFSVSSAGDVNGDGIDDFIVGAPGADDTGTDSGNAYVIYGTTTPANINLGDLGSTQGFAIKGHAAGDQTGFSVSAAGDVNGDGFDDVIVGAPTSDYSGGQATLTDNGALFVIFGGSNATDVDLSSPQQQSLPVQAFSGSAGGQEVGYKVSGSGDINGDGYSDVVVSSLSGGAAIFYGSGHGLSLGPTFNTPAGWNISSVGDINGDGYADIVFGIPGQSDGLGATVVMFGGQYAAGAPAETLNGTTAAETLIGNAGNDTIVGGGGADILKGGAGDDIISVATANFAEVAGGTGFDVFKLTGSGLTIGTDTIKHHALSSIEEIDLTGSGNNSLVLDRLSVQHLSEERHGGKAILTVAGNAGDALSFSDSGWVNEGTTVIDGITYRVYDNGNAEVRLELGVDAPAAVIDLGNMTPDQGILAAGIAGFKLGYSVASAGDINGDGYDDMLVGAPGTNANAAFVVLGSAHPTSVTSLNQTLIYGGPNNSQTGASVASAGDVNGDGLADIVIGGPASNISYVVYGATSPASNVPLTSMTSSVGFRITGEVAGDLEGTSVSAAGDVNGDGFGDLIVGAPGNGSGNGSAYVLLGGPSMTDINLASLTSAQGFSIRGSAAEAAGISVHAAGDINGDGLADLIVGASSNDSPGTDAGATYVVYGSATPGNVTLSALTTATGFKLTGVAGAHLGASVSAAGDINGDGIGDLIVGASGGTSGHADVVFGSTTAHGNLDVTTMTASQGFAIFGGPGTTDLLGGSVASAGDVNGDGYDDILIGAPGTAKGTAYLLFGGNDLSNVNLAHLTADQGVVIQGMIVGDQAGFSVASAGDINSDGYDDIMVGAPNNSIQGSQAGLAVVLYGSAFGLTQTPATTTGTGAADTLIGTAGNDTLTGGGGADVIRAGRGDDLISVSDATFRHLVGGHGDDTLALTGAGDSFDFATNGTSRVSSIESIDLTGTGAQSVTLTRLDVLHLSDDRSAGTTTLTIHGTAADTVTLSDNGWTAGGTTTIGADTFDIYTNGHARLLVDSDVTLAM
jgi:VCBS repeat-containing protein